eukprot:TRINITY_DN7404_c0_g2_i2.p1 TRINITY_DN7404_c0_g2~~TRINITY_DN7404_c0_g2_i2.p1  ORF type:complete len:350 (-),score=56.67 TRINITY_DN7404_c0_g2_i2:19-1068(-)
MEPAELLRLKLEFMHAHRLLQRFFTLVKGSIAGDVGAPSQSASNPFDFEGEWRKLLSAARKPVGTPVGVPSWTAASDHFARSEDFDFLCIDLVPEDDWLTFAGCVAAKLNGFLPCPATPVPTPLAAQTLRQPTAAIETEADMRVERALTTLTAERDALQLRLVSLEGELGQLRSTEAARQHLPKAEPHIPPRRCTAHAQTDAPGPVVTVSVQTESRSGTMRLAATQTEECLPVKAQYVDAGTAPDSVLTALMPISPSSSSSAGSPRGIKSALRSPQLTRSAEAEDPEALHGRNECIQEITELRRQVRQLAEWYGEAEQQNGLQREVILKQLARGSGASSPRQVRFAPGT